jgi:hypothetical protein
MAIQTDTLKSDWHQFCKAIRDKGSMGEHFWQFDPNVNFPKMFLSEVWAPLSQGERHEWMKRYFNEDILKNPALNEPQFLRLYTDQAVEELKQIYSKEG